MSSLLDSEAQFDHRLTECAVPQAIRNALKAHDIRTLAALSYSYGQPGQPIDNEAFTAWVRHLEPRATLGGVATLRRLTFESQTQLLALLKDQVTAPESAIRKIPQAERDSRMQLLKNRLPGLLLEGPNEPGHSLLDAVVSMVDKNQCKYLAPERCVSRMHELTTQKSADRMLEIESNKIVIKDKDEGVEVAAHTSLQVLEALRRRGVAFEFADCMGYQQHERYVQALFSHLHREPPAGYQRCTVSQLVSADKEAWKRIIEPNVRPKRDEHGNRGLDTALIAALTAYEVSFALIPLPSKQKADPKPPTKHENFVNRQSGRQKPQNRKGSSPYQKGKGKAKFDPRVPAQIRELGGTATTPSGTRICFDCGLGKCSHGADGAECQKGAHVCAKCYGPHPIKDHGKA